MADTKTTTKKERDEDAPLVPRPLPGDADATYVDPDLSYRDGSEKLPPAEQEWYDAREKAREEGVKAAEKGEEEAIKARQERAKEEQENRPQQAPVLTTEGPATTATAATSGTTSRS